MRVSQTLVFLAWAATAALAGEPRLLLRDDFHGQLNQWRGAKDAWVIRDGVLSVKDAKRGAVLEAGDESWADYVIEFRARIAVDILGDGHWGIHVRRRGGSGMYIFVRHEGLRFAGFGKSEGAVGHKGMSFPVGEWHRFKFTVVGGEAQVDVDGVYQGTVHGIANTTGGIALSCYNVSAEFADFSVTELPKSVGLTPRRRTDGKKLPLTQPVFVINSLPFEDRQRVITLTAEQLNLSEGQPLPRVSVLEKTSRRWSGIQSPLRERTLPAQFDDIDGDGKVSSEDEVCFLADLPPNSKTAFEVRLGASAEAAESPIAFSQTNASFTVKTSTFAVVGDKKGHWSFQPNGFLVYFLHCRPLEGEPTVRFCFGSVRVLILSKSELEENGLLTRRVEIGPSIVKMTTVLRPRDGTVSAFSAFSAFVKGAGGFWFELPALERVTDLRLRHADGWTSNSKRPVEDLYPAPAVPIAIDFVTQPLNVLVSYRQSLDYMPAMSLVGWHRYMRGDLAFGWRPPIEVKATAPHVQEVWVVAHQGGMEECKRLDRQVRSLPRILLAAEDSVQKRAGSRELLVNNPQQSLRERVAATLSETETLQRKAQSQNIEPTPALVLLGKARVCCKAAEWDINLDRFERASKRLKMAAQFIAQAKAYLSRPFRRILVLADAPPLPITQRASRITNPPSRITPYVTFSEGANKKMAALGLTVGHVWLAWGHWFKEFETEPNEGVWNFDTTDKIFQSASEAKMKLIALANYEPPRWFKSKFENPQNIPGQPPGSTGGDSLVSPELLGYIPPFMQAFGNYIAQMAKRYGDHPALLAWSVRNEPAYYSTGGVKGELMRRAWRNWLAKRYSSVEALNLNWGTNFTSLNEVKPPERWQENRAAWWDVMTFKAECLAGELKWESDLLTANGECQRTGAKYVPACLRPGSARAGFGVDPWLSSSPQRGISLVDLYTDDVWEAVLRTSELYYSGGCNPVISAETGRASRPPERVYKWHYFPDARARSLVWALFQHGLLGCHYWAWCSSEEYAALDWDGGICEFALQAALANQDFQPAGNILADLKPAVDAGYFYPRATFVQGSRDEIEAYQKLYALLTQMGYQLRPVSAVDFERVAPKLKALIIPPAPYVENAVRDKLADFIKRGGSVILVGENPGAFDEYTRRATPLTESLHGARVVHVPRMLGMHFGTGIPVADLKSRWRFRFGAKWAQAPGVAQTIAEGHIDQGMTEKWFALNLDDSGWSEIAVPGVWEENGYPNLDGYGWYRKRFTIPKSLLGKRLILSGDTLDDVAWVYVNGKLVRKTSSWDEVWKVEVSDLIRFGGENVIVLRILDNCYVGGVRGSIALTSPDIPSPDEGIARAALSKANVAPSTQMTSGGVFRTLMVDSHGRRHLILSNDNDNDASVSVSVRVPAPPGELLDLLSGTRWRSDGKQVRGSLPACGAAWIALIK